jgi:hypothetical protein
VLLRPDSLLLLDGRFKEMVRGLRCRGRELLGFPLLGNEAEVVVDLAYDAGFFPGFALSSILRGRFICLPSTLREDPATALRGLDEENVVLVGRERNYAGDETLTLRSVSCTRSAGVQEQEAGKYKKGQICDFEAQTRKYVGRLTLIHTTSA